MKTIKLETLEHMDACRPQKELFETLFGKEVEVTEELCVQHADKFSWNWASENLLLTTERMHEYDKEMGAGCRKMCEAQQEARSKRKATIAKGQAAFTKAVITQLEWFSLRIEAWNQYDKECYEAHCEFEKACATAFAKAYLAEGYSDD